MFVTTVASAVTLPLILLALGADFYDEQYHQTQATGATGFPAPEDPSIRFTIGRHTSGVYIICTTPFTESDAIDFVSLDRLLDFCITHDGTGITALGIASEADKLTPDERRAVRDRILTRTGSRR